MTFTAQYAGECDSCGGQLRGREVEYNASEELVHVICPEQATELNRPTCPSCFLELPVSGVCGDCS